MRVSVLLLAMSLFPAALAAQEEAPPSMELLEFLGEWGEANEGWFEQEPAVTMMLAGEAETNEQSNDEE